MKPRHLIPTAAVCLLLAGVVGLSALACGGCGLLGWGVPRPPGITSAGLGHTAALNWLAFACAGLAVLSIAIKAVVPTPFSTTLGFGACAVGCWTLEYILDKYLWLVAPVILFLVGLVIWEAVHGTANHADGKRGWLLRWWHGPPSGGGA